MGAILKRVERFCPLTNSTTHTIDNFFSLSKKILLAHTKSHTLRVLGVRIDFYFMVPGLNLNREGNLNRSIIVS